MNYIITSEKNNKCIYALEAEIVRLNDKIEEAQNNANNSLNSLPSGQIADLRSAVMQKELQKRDRELSIYIGLATALGRVNGKAWTNTICADTLIALAREFEDLLDARGIKVKNRAGALVRYRPPGKSSSRLQIGRSITTYVVLRRVRDGWRLVHAQRDYCFINQRAFREVIVRPAAHEDIIRHATRGFRDWDEPPTDTPPERPTT